MDTRGKHWQRARARLPFVAFVLTLGTCGAQIVRAASAPPVTQPLEKDRKVSERTAVSRVGGPDVRSPAPPGTEWVGGNGVVEPATRETEVAAQASAVVKAVLVEEGQQVKAGDLLVQLANGVEEAALRVAEAERDAEQAALARTLRGLRVEDRDAVAAEVEAARAKAELSAGVLTRTEQLVPSGAATPDELDRVRRQSQTDAANLKATEARLRAAIAGSRSEDVAAARARLAAAEARVLQAQAALERLAVRAPADAEVLQVKVQAGELYVQGAEPLLVLGDTRTLRVRMDVDERDVARVTAGASAYVVADAFGDQKFEGRVVEIGRRFGRKNVRTDDPVEKNDTKILEVLLELDANTQLVPGQRVVSYVAAQNPLK